MFLRKWVPLLIAGLSFCSPAVAQNSSFWDGRDAYLGEKPPSTTPIIFAPGKLADPGTFVMGRIAFSSDGKEIYYTQSNSWQDGTNLEIKYVRYRDGHWSKPERFQERFLTPTLAIDGNTMYMRRPKMDNVWESHRVGDGWTTPQLLFERSFGLYDFMPTASGNIYIGSEAGPADKQYGATYVFSVLTESNGDIRPRSLGQPLNEAGFNGDLYVAPDESFMIVSAKETKTYESELYISFSKPDRTWTEPVSLGPEINDGLAHRWGQYVTPDRKYLFYSHGKSEKDCAILWVRFDSLLARARASAFHEHQKRKP